MSRYIDADKMIEDSKSMKQVADGITIDGIIEYLEEHSTEEVSVVRHGEWKFIRIDENSNLPVIQCSICGVKTFGAKPYCFNCGAKMDRGHQRRSNA